MTRTGVIIIGAIAALGASGHAMAQTTAYASGQGSPNNIVLSIPVTATVGAQCGFESAPDATYNFPDLDLGFTQDTGFTLACNNASRVAIVSQNGGLLASGTAPAGFTTLAPYSVTLYLEGDSTTATGTCEVATLTASASSPCAFRGPASTTEGLELSGAATSTTGSYVRISAPVYTDTANLVASSGYADVLTVTLSAAL